MLRVGPIALLAILGFSGRARAQTGAMISVSTLPAGATVILDGTALGVTPLTGIPVEAGRHHLELVVAGSPTFDRDVDLTDGQRLVLEPPLARDLPPPPALAPPLPAAPIAATGATPEAKRPAHPWLDVPWPTWVAGGVAAGLFGVGLGFGVAAGNIDHLAGVDIAPSGVDLGLTRATALAGQQDATIANVLLVSAGLATLVVLGFAVLAPDPHANDTQPASSTK
jgi:PEGA domain